MGRVEEVSCTYVPAMTEGALAQIARLWRLRVSREGDGYAEIRGATTLVKRMRMNE